MGAEGWGAEGWGVEGWGPKGGGPKGGVPKGGRPKGGGRSVEADRVGAKISRLFFFPSPDPLLVFFFLQFSEVLRGIAVVSACLHR